MTAKLLAHRDAWLDVWLAADPLYVPCSRLHSKGQLLGSRVPMPLQAVRGRWRKTKMLSRVGSRSQRRSGPGSRVAHEGVAGQLALWHLMAGICEVGACLQRLHFRPAPSRLLVGASSWQITGRPHLMPMLAIEAKDKRGSLTLATSCACAAAAAMLEHLYDRQRAWLRACSA